VKPQAPPATLADGETKSDAPPFVRLLHEGWPSPLLKQRPQTKMRRPRPKSPSRTVIKKFVLRSKSSYCRISREPESAPRYAPALLPKQPCGQDSKFAVPGCSPFADRVPDVAALRVLSLLAADGDLARCRKRSTIAAGLLPFAPPPICFPNLGPCIHCTLQAPAVLFLTLNPAP
jgi:hypothetical protein